MASFYMLFDERQHKHSLYKLSVCLSVESVLFHTSLLLMCISCIKFLRNICGIFVWHATDLCRAYSFWCVYKKWHNTSSFPLCYVIDVGLILSEFCKECFIQESWIGMWSAIFQSCNPPSPLHMTLNVAATMKVYPDFFLYRSGVYHHSGNGPSGYHSVRIIGWGEEVTQREPIKFWVSIHYFAMRHSLQKVNEKRNCKVTLFVPC
jgi:hypothetical protein